MIKFFSPRFLMVVAALCLMAFTADPEAKKITLRLNLEKGQSYQVENRVEQEIVQTIMGTENTIEQRMGYFYDYEVQDLVEGNYDIQVTYTDILFEQTAQGMTTSYDSRDTASDVPMGAQAQASLVGESFRMTMTPEGRISTLSGMDAIIEKIAGDMQMPGVPAEQMRAQLESQMGDEAMRSNMSETMAIYPDGPVRKGDSWTRKGTVRSQITLDLVSTYTLDRVSDGKAYVSVDGELSTNEDAEPTEMMGMTMVYDLGGTQKGTMVIDVETGLTLESNLTQLISGQITASGGQMGNQTMEIPMRLESNITTKMME